MVLDDSSFRRLCQARELLTHGSASIRDVARQVGISPFHFIRKFESVFGLTPHQYRIDARIGRAKRLLASGELSVTETCMEVGMSSLGSFSDLFLRRVGDTPSAFQRRARVWIQVPGLPPPEFFPGCYSLLSNLPPGSSLR